MQTWDLVTYRGIDKWALTPLLKEVLMKMCIMSILTLVKFSGDRYEISRPNAIWEII